MFITLLLVLGCLFGCDVIIPSGPSTVTVDDMAYDVGHFSTSLASTNGSPNPAPPKPDNGKCQNCNGLGWIGDGRVWASCPECNADEHIPRPRSEGGDQSIVTPQPDLKAELQLLPEATAKATAGAMAPLFDRMIDKLQPKAEPLPSKVMAPAAPAQPSQSVTQGLPSAPQRAPPVIQEVIVDNGVRWPYLPPPVYSLPHESTLGPVRTCPPGATCPANGTQLVYPQVQWSQGPLRRRR